MAHAIHPRGTRFWRYPGINPRRVVATLLGGVWHRWLAGNSLATLALQLALTFNLCKSVYDMLPESIQTYACFLFG